ncbi:MAG TPA: glycoside hydrolase family 3 N-terminal domain-containing protein, partial [Pyrinomonadaceae bacterium]
ATLYGYNRVLKDELPTPDWKNKIWKDGIANIDEHLNGWGQSGSTSIYANDIKKHVWAMNEVQRFFVEETRLGIPVDFTNEGVRGVAFTKATSFPSQLALAHTWNPELVREIGRITAREARALGYTNIYAPIMDMGRDQRWGRYEDTYGEDPFLAGILGVEMVKGLQENFTVAATSKHFAIHGVNKGAREGEGRVDPQISPREAEYIFNKPFGKVIKEGGLLGVMASYNDYDGAPVVSSKYWLIERLRKQYGFRGYVVSDSGAVEDLYVKHQTAADMKEAVRQSIEAGLNVKTNFTPPDDFILPLRELVKAGKVSMPTLDDRVRDVLRVKFLVGMFDNPYVKDADASERLVNSPENKAVALRAARESVVLLKNEGNILPLSKEIRSIAVIGPNADNKSNLTYRYGVSKINDGLSALDGIKAKFGDKVTVNYAKGSEVTNENWAEEEILPTPLTAKEKDEIEKAVETARKSDVAVVFLGDQTTAYERPGPLTVGESSTRTSLDLPGRQLQLIQAVYAVGKPTVVVLINGRPMSINWVNKNVPAILETWFPGGRGGEAIADVLFGDYNPGGKLTCTFPKSAGQIPFNFPSKPNAQWEQEKSRVNGALYYFGHGLSYTTFAYSNLKISPLKQSAGGNVTVSFDVKNSGARRDGDEVVQLYVRDCVSSTTTYEKNLRGFRRVHLKPGETNTVSFTLKPEDLELLDADMRWTIEPGMFKVMVGASSEDIRLNGEFEIR